MLLDGGFRGCRRVYRACGGTFDSRDGRSRALRLAM